VLRRFETKQEDIVTDPRNIAHDKKVADQKRKDGEDASEEAAVQPQPGKKPPKVSQDTDPSNSRANELYKKGQTPRDHAHESSEHPPEGEERIKPDAPRHDPEQR